MLLILAIIISFGCEKENINKSNQNFAVDKPITFQKPVEKQIVKDPHTILIIKPISMTITVEDMETTTTIGSHTSTRLWKRYTYAIRDAEDESLHMFIVRPNCESKFNLDKIRQGRTYRLAVRPGSDDETIIDSIEEVT